MAEGEGFVSRLIHKLSGTSPHDPDFKTPMNPALGKANVLDQAARSMDRPVGVGGGLSSTPPTAEGLARAQETAPSISPVESAPGK